jgi:hypothetical protein
MAGTDDRGRMRQHADPPALMDKPPARGFETYDLRRRCKRCWKFKPVLGGRGGPGNRNFRCESCVSELLAKDSTITMPNCQTGQGD